ncbi:uncharacterized protein LTR77_001836 [Saxophila tyrrhenica]|uniref:Uncharacterized protein n=1 Tax=Saxophila tyrrhenica TaxID=1690608 RepID=A0AAV9PL92_9PEZI|nr:hypothetical protein LTR77_001836 [Saxophila tyrrhenica]
MAETSCLTSAHGNARAAAKEFDQVNFMQASEHHQRASADFARAAKGTSDSEALRVLKLLEAQHQKLTQLVKLEDASHQGPSKEAAEATEGSRPVKAERSTTPSSKPSRSAKPESTTSALASARINKQSRDASPSLARDIASRRGIPQATRQPSAAAQARARQLSPESRRKAVPKVPPSIVDSQADLARSRVTKRPDDDDGFAKFYSNLTTGTMSKLSSVLAYAGLPLTAEDAVKYDQPSTQKAGKRTVSASNDPDVKKIFSKAALEAIEDEHRQRGTLGRGFGPAESFYVVQKGGGTYSYADIAKAQQQQAAGEDSEPEFVDAKEVRSAAASQYVRKSRSKRGSFGMPRTQEELELENSTLKNTLEQLAARLANFEAHAQDASMAALEQSMMIVKPGPATAHASTSDKSPTREGGDKIDPGVQERLRQLELQVEQRSMSEQEWKEKSAKQARELKKYRHYFDELKSSAKEKEKTRIEKKETFSVGDGVTGE